MKILIATGGSGGHIFPALFTAKELKGRGHQVYFAGALGEASYNIQDSGFEFFEISSRGFSLKSFSEFLTFWGATTKAFWSSLRVLQKIDPDVVTGFGGYGAFPVTFGAAVQGIPTIIHEQNVLPGKANRVLSCFAKKIAVSFSGAAKNFPPGKTVLTGCPCRPLQVSQERKRILAEFGLKEGVFTILVLGGSQGSRRINKEFLETAIQLKDRLAFQVIHITGKNDLADVRAKYAQMGVAAKVFDFTDQMEKIYAAGDLVVSRAGAMTVTEIAAFALPAILIPYPYAGGHQRYNAFVLSDTKVSRTIEEKDLSSDVLLRNILEFRENAVTKEEIAKMYADIYRPRAAQDLADEIERSKK